MTHAKTLWVAATMLVVAFAGCTDEGSDGLNMLVTAGADPVADPYTFEARGSSAETFTWDMGDGTILDGKTVEHTFGFTDGEVIVKLTACTGEDCESKLGKIDLGGERNIPPQGAMVVTTEWTTVGETFALDATGSTDQNGDPLLYRWSCERLEDLRPPDDGGGHSHGPPGVPFGVNALATYDETLVGTEDHGADLCADFAFDVDQPWSRDTGSITGQFSEPGLYRWELQVRDPKSQPWIGRLDLYVSETRPEAVLVQDFSGTIPGGSGGELDDQCNQLQDQGGPECPTTDRMEFPFTVELPNALSTVTFAGSGPTGSAQWSIKVGEATVSPASTDDSKFLGPLTFVNGRDYRVIVETAGPGTQVSFDLSIEHQVDLNPRHLFQMPP